LESFVKHADEIITVPERNELDKSCILRILKIADSFLAWQHSDNALSKPGATNMVPAGTKSAVTTARGAPAALL